MRVADDHPPLLTLLLRVVLGVDWPIENLKGFLIDTIFVIVFLPHQRDEQLDRLLNAVSTDRVRFTSPLCLVLYLDHRVPVADVGKACHLVI